MATAVASRFSVLCDDVDDDYSTRKRRPQPKKQDLTKPVAAAPAKAKDSGKKKKNKENTQSQPSQAAKPKNKADNGAAVKKKKNPQPADPQSWEEWKVKDEQLVDVNYKDDLTQALLLSKLDFEEKKVTAKTVEPAQDSTPSQPPETDKKGKKKKTIKVLSVEEFHKLGKVKSREQSPALEEEPEDDPEFFQRLEAEISHEAAKKPLQAKKQQVRKPLDEEALSLAQVRDKLDKKIDEMEELRLENGNLRKELQDVKNRNKTLCQILASGEMKNKAEILMEVERLQTVRDELSEQVADLAGQLEQERSRVRALTNDTNSKSNHKNKKRTTSSGDN